MNKENSHKKELLIYLIIVIVLIILSVCNNLFWKLGKQQDTYNIENNVTYFESDNIIYNVPYYEQWLD